MLELERRHEESHVVVGVHVEVVEEERCRGEVRSGL
jgi:hypothetical protein